MYVPALLGAERGSRKADGGRGVARHRERKTSAWQKAAEEDKESRGKKTGTRTHRDEIDEQGAKVSRECPVM